MTSYKKKIKLPVIPGEIYKADAKKYYGEMLILIFCSSFCYFTYSESGFSFQFSLCFALSFFYFYRLFVRKYPLSVYLDSNTIKAKYNKHPKIIQRPLEDFLLLVEECQLGTKTDHYTYKISLIPKQNVDLIISTEDGKKIMAHSGNSRMRIGENAVSSQNDKISYFIRSFPKKDMGGNITILEDVPYPDILKEWVETLQNQILVQLPVIFSSENIRQDFETGIYQSYKKS